MYAAPHLSQPQISHSSIPPSHMDHQTSSVPPIAYNSPQSSTQPMTEFPQMDSGLAVHVFNQGVTVQQVLKEGKDNSYERDWLYGIMARLCTKPKSPRNDSCLREKGNCWLKYKNLVTFWMEEKLAFLTDPGIPDGQDAQQTILNTVAF
ncbi:hypothetical protein Tco_0343996 [Tanacetum coccineum]